MTASAQHGRGVARASAKQRHRCRNSKCRSKLPEPRASIHSAFCTKGCWQQFHRKRCVVCEKEFERTAEHQLNCGRRKCRAELKRQPEIYRPFHRGLYAQKLLPAPTPHAVPSAPSETLEKWASKPRFITGLRWARPDREDDDWELSGPDGDGWSPASAKREADGGWRAQGPFQNHRSKDWTKPCGELSGWQCGRCLVANAGYARAVLRVPPQCGTPMTRRVGSGCSRSRIGRAALRGCASGSTANASRHGPGSRGRRSRLPAHPAADKPYPGGRRAGAAPRAVKIGRRPTLSTGGPPTARCEARLQGRR